jgi:hypothetical protein
MEQNYTISGTVLQKVGDGMPRVIPMGQKDVPKRDTAKLIGNVTVGLFRGKIEQVPTRPFSTTCDFSAEKGFSFSVKEPGWYTVLLFYDGQWQQRAWDQEHVWTWWRCGYLTKSWLCPYVWISDVQRHVTKLQLPRD